MLCSPRWCCAPCIAIPLHRLGSPRSRGSRSMAMERYLAARVRSPCSDVGSPWGLPRGERISFASLLPGNSTGQHVRRSPPRTTTTGSSSASPPVSAPYRPTSGRILVPCSKGVEPALNARYWSSGRDHLRREMPGSIRLWCRRRLGGSQRAPSATAQSPASGWRPGFSGHHTAGMIPTFSDLKTAAPMEGRARLSGRATWISSGRWTSPYYSMR